MYRNQCASKIFITFAALSLSMTVGCGSKSPPAPATAQTGSATTASAAGGNPSADSQVTLVNEGVETAPAQTVAIFLDSLRKGDERAANGVLTTLARQELAKTAYQIQPLGTPAGQYKIGRVGFPYAEKNVALVECTWVEPPVEGNAQEVMDIVCEVHQETDGWRISGIGVTIPGSDQALVLDFEDAASLQATIDAATGQTSPTTTPPAGTQIATGQAVTGAQSAPAGLPPFPSGPALPTAGAATGTAMPNVPQMAMPPLNNAPLNR
jgi:hypothetical protein